MNKHEERIAIIETQLSSVLKMNSARYEANLARCYLQTGRYEEARDFSAFTPELKSWSAQQIQTHNSRSPACGTF